MAKLRHISLSVQDPWATAEFYMKAFDMKKVGEVDISFVLGVFLSDGIINMAIRMNSDTLTNHAIANNAVRAHFHTRS